MLELANASQPDQILLLLAHAEREESAFLSPLPAVLGPPLLHSALSVLDITGQQSRKLF